MKARSISRKRKPRTISAAKTSAASECFQDLQPGCELYILTFGQFSLIDALVALLDVTGPAKVDISTWTAAYAHLDRSKALMESAAITDLRFLVDRSFLTRQPEYCQHLRSLFGDRCIRTYRAHSKFMTVKNDKWSLAIRTSMNLNENPRLENIEVSDDPALCAFMTRVVDDVFAEHDEGEFGGKIPDLHSIPDTGTDRGVTFGEIKRELRPPTT